MKQDFPPKIYAEVQDSFKNFHALGYFQNMERDQRCSSRRSLRRWVQSGALIGMGTDSGTPMNFHTEALWREMKLFVDYGMSPQRAISSATRINARILGRGRDLGTIEPGKLADIIVVNGESALRHHRARACGGRDQGRRGSQGGYRDNTAAALGRRSDAVAVRRR